MRTDEEGMIEYINFAYFSLDKRIESMSVTIKKQHQRIEELTRELSEAKLEASPHVSDKLRILHSLIQRKHLEHYGDANSGHGLSLDSRPVAVDSNASAQLSGGVTMNYQSAGKL